MFILLLLYLILKGRIYVSPEFRDETAGFMTDEVMYCLQLVPFANKNTSLATID